jgi:steroid 5-alpha reductase family enzyme
MVFPFVIALLAMSVALCALMAGAWIVQQRTGNSGWVDTIWTFSVGLVGAAAALWPVSTDALPARQWMVGALVTAWALRLGLHIAVRSASNHDDPRYAEYARRWGDDAPRQMFVFLQQQALGSIDPAGACDLRRRATAGDDFPPTGSDRRADPVCRHCR